MATNITITTDTINTKTGTWFYASRSLLRRFFKLSYDTGRNQYALVKWLKRNNVGKINLADEYFITGSTITVPADECSIACIIGTELYGTVVSHGRFGVTATNKRPLKPSEINDFINTVGDSYRGVPVNLNIVRVVEQSPTVLDIRWAATLAGVHIPESDQDIEDSLKNLQEIINRGMSLPNNTIYLPGGARPTNDEMRALLNHEIDHQYTYQIYDPKAVFKELLREQRWYKDYLMGLNSIDPYKYLAVSGLSLNNIRSLNDIKDTNNQIIYEAQAQYIEDYSRKTFDPNWDPNTNQTDYKVFHP
jgi:hypothetical protein